VPLFYPGASYNTDKVRSHCWM